ncbi:hypothetical protein T484DRAFT_1826277 [Baffinella frigidus]|nr:hypothetical protein T484DRAFT_1826277 [Cryptophyta sp. CCMP2293]
MLMRVSDAVDRIPQSPDSSSRRDSPMAGSALAINSSQRCCLLGPIDRTPSAPRILSLPPAFYGKQSMDTANFCGELRAEVDAPLRSSRSFGDRFGRTSGSRLLGTVPADGGSSKNLTDLKEHEDAASSRSRQDFKKHATRAHESHAATTRTAADGASPLTPGRLELGGVGSGGLGGVGAARDVRWGAHACARAVGEGEKRP